MMIKDIVIFITSFGITITLSVLLLAPLWDMEMEQHNERLSAVPIMIVFFPVLLFFFFWTILQYYFTRYED